MGLFHKHDYPRANYSDTVVETNENGHTFITGTVMRYVRVGDDWTCKCGKQFYVFTLNYNQHGEEIPDWREVGKFK